MRAIKKSEEDTNTKTRTTTKTQTKCLKHSAYVLYFWNPDDSLIPNMIIDTSPWSSCSHRSPWLSCYSHTISSTGPIVSPFRYFFLLLIFVWYFLGRISKTLTKVQLAHFLLELWSGNAYFAPWKCIWNISTQIKWGASLIFSSEIFVCR